MNPIPDFQCPNCKQKRLAELSSIAPKLVKCDGCEATFDESFVRGYWQDRPELSQVEMVLLYSAVDYCSQLSTVFEINECYQLEGIGNKLLHTIPSEAFQKIAGDHNEDSRLRQGQ